jgi:hypothetical protein
VSFSAITLCIASQRVFIVVSVKCDPRFSADLKEQRFCFKLGKTASKMHEIFETAFGDNANVLFTSEESETSHVEHQEHGGDLFLLLGHYSPGICSSRPNGEPHYYLDVLKRLRKQVCRKRPKQRRNQDRLLRTTTMRRRTLLCLCSGVWPLETWLWSPTLLTVLIQSLGTYFVSENEIEAKRASFPGCH